MTDQAQNPREIYIKITVPSEYEGVHEDLILADFLECPANFPIELIAFEQERAKVVKLREALQKYKNECETKAPDALYKRECRDQLFKLFEETENKI